MSLPKNVLIREDGPREGFQMHRAFVATADKLRLINALAETGVTSIEATSFVRPDLVPQHKDAEEVARGLKPNAEVRFSALYLNEKGFLRARSCSQLQLEGFVHWAASDAFLKKNMNSSIQGEIDKLPRWVEVFSESKTSLERLIVSTAFGEPTEGRVNPKKVVSVVRQAKEKLAPLNCFFEELTLADTTGWANPELVRKTVSLIRDEWPDLKIGLHFHDTRGLGLANIYAGLCVGVSRYDCSVGGLGGCPFTPGAAGNVATEDVVFMCQELGIHTGIDLERYISCVKLAEQLVGHELPGKLAKAGLLPR